jgi:hypothetical protein
MERGICHGKCQDCEQRFSHATKKGRLQCDIIGEMLARNDSEDLYQCSRSTCCKWDILYKIEEGHTVDKPLPIVGPVPNHPNPWRMTAKKELAIQKILHPAMGWTPSAAELVVLDRTNERNL